MKIKNIFKLLIALGAVTAVGLTIGLYVQMIPRKFPNVQILTKETYLNWKNNQDVSINFDLLPTSKYSLRDVLDKPKSVNGGNFLFYFGSQAYAETNYMLRGINENYVTSQGKAPIYSNSLIYQLLDTFYGENTNRLGLNKFEPIFLNYLDIVEREDIYNAWDLKHKRESTLGDFVTDVPYRDSTGKIAEPPESEKENYKMFEKNGQQVWYKIDKFKWQVGEGRDTISVPVVKGVTDNKSADYAQFNLEPNPDAYYEWRPNNEKDTEYEKVYYRRTADVYNFLDNFAFIEKYLSNTYQISNTNKNGMLICFRNLNIDDYDTTISNPFDIKVISGLSSDYSTLRNTIDTIITFYNPDYDPDKANDDNENDNSDNSDGSTTNNIVYQTNYQINKLSSNDNLNELNKNISIINKKDY